MRTRTVRCFASAVALVLFGTIARGTVFDPLSDRDLVGKADAIVVGTVVDSLSKTTASGAIVTESRLHVERVLKGGLSVSEIVTVTEYGGAADGKIMFIVGGARYSSGERVLVFLGRNPGGGWHTTGMSLGRFVFGRDPRGTAIVARSTDGEADQRPRLAKEFQQFVGDVLAGRDSSAAYFTAPLVARTAADHTALSSAYSASAYALNVGPGQVRIKDGETGNVTIHYGLTGSVTGADGSSSASDATAAWRSDPNSKLRMDTAASAGSTAGTSDGLSSIYLGYTGSEPGGIICEQTTACAIIWISTDVQHTFNGETFFNILEADVVFKPDTYTQQKLDVLMAHELGHTIGLRHSDAPIQPSTSTAIMASTTNVSFGTNLQQWDRDAIDTMYGSGPPCQLPSNVSVTGGGTVTSSQTAQLSATASGSTPITFQWYQGTSGDAGSTPLGTGSSMTTPPVTATMSFWVNAKNSCGNANSATVTVSPAVCQQAAITSNPVSQTITSGQTATLYVAFSGTPPFTLQWYQGQGGDTTHPVPGAASSSFTTPALTTTTSYWVQVSSSCGSPANSATATITVPGTCATPVFTLQPQATTVSSGQTTYLGATASGATSYAWYQGAIGDTSTPLTAVSGESNTFYVTALYLDLSGQPPDAATTSLLVGQLDSEALTRQQVAASVVSSSTYRKQVVQRLFSRYLGRSATQLESDFFFGQMTGGATDLDVAASIIGGSDYYTRAGASFAGFLAFAYNDILGRAPTAAESAHWSGYPRALVAQALLTSAEGRTVATKEFFNQILHRNPSGSEAQLGTTLSSNEALVLAILQSQEYANFESMAIVGPITAATSFWVAATNSCGTTNSSAGTASTPACTKPAIVVQPQSATIDLGSAPTITVIATGAASYQWYRGNFGDISQPISGATSQLYSGTQINTPGTVSFWVRVTNSCDSVDSATAAITVSCSVSTGPVLSLPPSWPSATAYTITWTGDPQAYDHYELQESPTSSFDTATTITATTASYTVPAHTVTTDTRYYYRVRGFLKCGAQTPQPYSTTASTLVVAPVLQSLSLNPVGSPCVTQSGNPCKITGSITGTYIKPGKQALDTTDTFSVTADKTFITFSPSSGTVPSSGSVTVDYTIDTTNLPGGSTETTVTFAFNSVTTSSSGVAGTLSTTTTTSNIPLSVNLVSPVSPVPKDNNPPPNTMIIPAVAHAAGINSQFVSDLRLVNTATQAVTYMLTFTPTATDGTQNGKSFQMSIAPGETKAINDIVETWFGAGAAGEGGLGTVEIRPMNYLGKVGGSLVTVAASRTYNVTPSGTFGQFVPAIPVANFLKKSDTAKISLQQVAQSAAYRTNLGIVEGSGQAVSYELRLLDPTGKVVSTTTRTLKPYEFQQQSFGVLFPGVTLNDGRVEVRVLSDAGTVSAYASVLDNNTNDPLAVFPVQPNQVLSRHYVVPGVADLNNGAANFHTDMRIFNGGSTPVTATATYVPQAGSPGANAPVTLTIEPGEVKLLDDTVKASFGVTNSGGAVVVTTPGDSSLVLTARTFSRNDKGGTFGQFIPGLTSTDGVGANERPLQVIQLEESPAFRSNVGVVEVTGNPVDVLLRGYTPDSKFSAKVEVSLGANQFVQFGHIFKNMGYGNVYNGRVTAEVVGGTGRVAAYGSVIDNRTEDPTYVPAQ